MTTPTQRICTDDTTVLNKKQCEDDVNKVSTDELATIATMMVSAATPVAIDTFILSKIGATKQNAWKTAAPSGSRLGAPASRLAAEEKRKLTLDGKEQEFTRREFIAQLKSDPMFGGDEAKAGAYWDALPVIHGSGSEVKLPYVLFRAMYAPYTNFGDGGSYEVSEGISVDSSTPSSFEFEFGGQGHITDWFALGGRVALQKISEMSRGIGDDVLPSAWVVKIIPSGEFRLFANNTFGLSVEVGVGIGVATDKVSLAHRGSDDEHWAGAALRAGLNGYFNVVGDLKVSLNVHGETIIDTGEEDENGTTRRGSLDSIFLGAGIAF